MKKIFGALVIALLAIGANAQTFEKGSSIVTAQLGIGGGFGQRVAYEYSLMNLLDGKAAIGVGGSLNNCFSSNKNKGDWGKEKWGYNPFCRTADMQGCIHAVTDICRPLSELRASCS